MPNKTFLHKQRYIEEVILFIVLLLSLIGMGITDFSPLESHRYWSLMIIVFAIASIALGWTRSEFKEEHFKKLIVWQSIHWGATLATVSGVYLLLQTGRLNYESAGLIIELILGLSLFLDGRQLGWRVSLLGILVGVTAIIAAYVEEYIWVVLLLSLCVAVISYYWEKQRRNSIQNNG